MISVKVRLFILLTFLTGSSFAIGFVTFKEYSALRSFQRQLDYSYILGDEIRDLNQRERAQIVPTLQKYREQLTPPSRMESLSNLIQAISENNVRLIKERQTYFLKNETEFQRYSRERIQYYDEKLNYNAALLAIVLGFAFFALQFFMQASVLRPMKQLARKMTDFMNDRYTYQFSVPGSDEFGQMQSTFNSLAQRVISNMEQLRTLDQAKSEFLSIASHELRTPLTSIKGSLSLMRSGVVGSMNELAENLLKIAEIETDRLIRLINDILDLAKIEAGKLPMNLEWVSLKSLIESNLQSLSGLAHSAEVQLQMVDIPSVEVYIDKDRIQQVMTNLLSNAIKYSPQNKPVSVRCEIDASHHMQISIQDLGRGIAPEDQELIFQKFRQATSPKNPLVKGTGLGLAIAKALVEQHDGNIGVKSVPGQGSVFYFTVPEWRFVNQESSVEAA